MLGINLSLTGQLLNSVRGFTPVSLFALAEPGVWYDPSDLTTMFQDAAGTTPVTAAGQPVGLVLDKSQGLVLGPELLPNSFSSGAWTSFAAGVSVASGVVTFSNVIAGSNGLLLSAANGSPYQASKSFEVVLTISSYVSGGLRVWTGAGYTQVYSANGVFTFRVYYPADQSLRVYAPATGANTSLSATISVRELAGNHATQATAASRPTYGVVPATGRRNLLTYTEQFDNAAWVKSNCTISANAITAPDGSLTADQLFDDGTLGAHYIGNINVIASTNFSRTTSVWVKGNTARYVVVTSRIPNGVNTQWNNIFDTQGGVWVYTGASGVSGFAAVDAGNGWWKISFVDGTDSSAYDNVYIGVSSGPNLADIEYSGSGQSIYIWGAQLEAGSTATNYQRVGSAFDVTEAGVQSLGYLSFDGVDDFLVTPTITPGIDKVQVFAGVRKLSDAAGGMIAETSVNANSTNGTLRITPGNNAAGNLAFYSWSSRGTVQAQVETAGVFASPITNVITGLGDISGDVARLRVNGSQVAETLTNQGTGNYLAYPLYIGRRAGTSLPFNGNLFSLIVRFGANLDANTISQTETWVNSKTGAY